MKNKYIVKFFYNEEHLMFIPLKADNPETIIEKIITNKNGWISFPMKNKFTRSPGTEQIIINLEKVKYFRVELPTKLSLEKYEEDDFILW